MEPLGNARIQPLTLRMRINVYSSRCTLVDQLGLYLTGLYAVTFTMHVYTAAFRHESSWFNVGDLAARVAGFN